MNFTELTEQEFRHFVKKCKVKDFLQSYEMYRRYQRKGQEAYLVGVKRSEEGKSDELVAGALVEASHTVLQQKFFNAPRGFLMNYEAMESGEILETMTVGLKKFLKEKDGMVLEISPKVARKVKGEWEDGGRTKETLERLGYKNLGEYEQVKWIYTLETKDREVEELKASFRKGHKLSIRYATERYGLKVRELKRSELKLLKEVADAAGERHGFRAPEVGYFEEMWDAFGEKVKFVVSEMKDKNTGEWVITAGAMFIIYGGEVVYLFSGSLSEYKKYGGPHLIQWKMIQYALKFGLKYNFYGTHPGDGVYEFKAGFRGEMEELLGTFMLPLTVRGRLYLLRKRYAEYRDVA